MEYINAMVTNCLDQGYPFTIMRNGYQSIGILGVKIISMMVFDMSPFKPFSIGIGS